LKFRGPKLVKSKDLEQIPPNNATPTVKKQRKFKKPAQCSEQVECPLRSKCKLGVCLADPAKS